MSYTFRIADNEISFSEGKVQYVHLKREFQKISDDAEKQFEEILPETSSSTFSKTFEDTVAVSLLTDVSWFEGKADKYFPKKNYGFFQKFIDNRNKYVCKYIELLTSVVTKISDDLQTQRIYVDTDELLLEAIENSRVRDKLLDCANSLSARSNGYNSVYSDVVAQVRNQCSSEEYDMRNGDSISEAICENLVEPLNSCFRAVFESQLLQELILLNTEGNIFNKDHIPGAVTITGEKIFSNPDIQKALIQGIGTDTFCCYIIKRKLYQENNLCDYEIISSDDSARAEALHKLYTSKTIIEEDEKKMMTDALCLDPFFSIYYNDILDKYYDPNGELQRLALLMGVDIATCIENKLLDMYNQADIGTLESTLEIKAAIIEEQKKYALETSKALKAATTRQYFIELMDKAVEMDCDTVVDEWQSIKDGNNTFVADKRELITDDQCIDILSRRFRKIHAANYHDLIRNLGLTDDTSEGDKNYGFYEENENYILFEEACCKATGFKIERDGDLKNQNYNDESLASGEVMLGYFHYTRQLDVIGDGKSMIITNKRIYTSKEKFTSLSEIACCKPMKKLLLNYVVFEKNNDSAPIQLPVSKEIMISAADMINRLISALEGREYSEISEIEVAKTTDVINDTFSAASKQISDKFGKAKKGLKSLFK